MFQGESFPERLFNMFDTSHCGKLSWPEFKKGVEECMFSSETDFDKFLFRFFSMDRYGVWWKGEFEWRYY